MVERAYILVNPEPPSPEGFVVVGVVCKVPGGRRTDFYFAGNDKSAEHLIKLLTKSESLKNAG